jgi:transcriptional regulator of arginine metabolism
MKGQRLQDICRLIQAGNVKTQNDLLNGLIEKGYDVTQATLSRDMRQLKITKRLDANNHYVYALPEAVIPIKPASAIREIEFAGNLVIIKTRQGYAQGVAADIDRMGLREIAGTIAGNDTILVVPKDGFNRKHVTHALSVFMRDVPTVTPSRSADTDTPDGEEDDDDE